jgi:hypothetical protein
MARIKFCLEQRVGNFIGSRAIPYKQAILYNYNILTSNLDSECTKTTPRAAQKLRLAGFGPRTSNEGKNLLYALAATKFHLRRLPVEDGSQSL